MLILLLASALSAIDGRLIFEHNSSIPQHYASIEYKVRHCTFIIKSSFSTFIFSGLFKLYSSAEKKSPFQYLDGENFP